MKESRSVPVTFGCHPEEFFEGVIRPDFAIAP